MADAMCTVVENKIKRALAMTNFIRVIGDKVTMVDNQSWLYYHTYAM